MQTYKPLVATLFAIGSLSPAYADTPSVSTGIVSSAVTDLANNGYTFAVAGSRTPKPACATEDNWAIPPGSTAATDTKARMMYSSILASYATGRQIIVQGTGSCDGTFTHREVVAYIQMN